MQYQIETETGRRIVLKECEYLDFAAGTVTDAYEVIHDTSKSDLSSSPSVQEIKGHVLKGLLRQLPILSIPDVRELRVLLDVDIEAETPIDDKIVIIFEAAIQIITRWAECQYEQQGVSA